MSSYNASKVYILTAGSNTSFSSLTAALNSIAFFYPIEILYLSIFLSFSVSGVLLNIISLFIFSQKQFQIPLYIYLRCISFVGIVGNLVAIIRGIMSCPDFLPAANNFIGQWMDAFIYMGVYNVSFHFKILLDIVIVIDRIIVFAPRLKAFYKLAPYQLMLILLAMAIVLNLPYFFLYYYPNRITFLLEDSQVWYMWTQGLFTWSKYPNYGYYIMYVIYFFKNFLTFIVAIVVNIASLILFRRHFSAKAKLTYTQSIAHNSSQTKSVQAEKNMYKMVFVNAFASFLHACIVLTFTITNLNTAKTNLTIRVLQFLSHFMAVLRHWSNFLLFYSFNNIFEKEFRLILIKLHLAQPRMVVLESSKSTGQSTARILN